jgi:hypothetical protein
VLNYQAVTNALCEQVEPFEQVDIGVEQNGQIKSVERNGQAEFYF